MSSMSRQRHAPQRVSFPIEAIGRMALSTLLLSMRPSVRKSFRPSQYLAI